MSSYAKLGKAVRDRVFGTREPRHGESLAEMHPALREKIVPSVDLAMDAAACALDSIFAMVLRGDNWSEEEDPKKRIVDYLDVLLFDTRLAMSADEEHANATGKFDEEDAYLLAGLTGREVALMEVKQFILSEEEEQDDNDTQVP